MCFQNLVKVCTLLLFLLFKGKVFTFSIQSNAPCGCVIHSSIMVWYIPFVPNLLKIFHLKRMLSFYGVNEHNKEEIKNIIPPITASKRIRYLKVNVSESCSLMSNSLWPPGLYSPWNSPGHIMGVGSLSLLQGLLPTQGSNPSFPHCRQNLY